MKKLLFAVTLAALIISSCTNVLDKKLNQDDFTKVKEAINSNDAFTQMKKKYIIDNLTMQLGFAGLGEAMKLNVEEFPTFREQIDDLSTDYDSIRNVKLINIENNKRLKDFLVLKDAKALSVDKYKGYLSMTLDFNNEFEKEILYIILNYKYVDKYDTEYFDSKSKLTDKIAENFENEVEISTTEQYNDVAEFMYSKVPIRASDAKRKELGAKVADKQVMSDYLLEGLKVETLGIVFTDKSELMFQDEDWEYL